MTLWENTNFQWQFEWVAGRDLEDQNSGHEHDKRRTEDQEGPDDPEYGAGMHYMWVCLIN